MPEINKYIEEETMTEAVKTTLPYHLHRIDQRQLPLNGFTTPLEMEKMSIFILLTQAYHTNTQNLEIEPSILGTTQ